MESFFNIERKSENEKNSNGFRTTSTLSRYSGWNQSAFAGLEKIEKELGEEILYNENTQPSDYEKILREYVKQDCDLIVGHGYQFVDASKVKEQALTMIRLTYNPALETKIPADVKSKMDEITASIKDGTLKVEDYIK